MGTRLTVFPRAAWAVLRGLGRDADVVLEVVNGIAFLTPLWLRKPRVTLVHHVHQDHYVTELGRAGEVAGLVAEALPLKLLYGDAPFLTISESAARRSGRARRPPDATVGYLGVVPLETDARRSDTPRLLYLGRLKKLQADRVAARRRRGHARRRARHRRRGRPPAGPRGRDRAPRPRRPRAAARACLRGAQGGALRTGVGERDRVLGRGLVPDGHGGRDRAGRRARRCASAGCRSRSSTASPACWPTTGRAWHGRVQRLVADTELRESMGAAAKTRAATFTWERTARETLDLLTTASEEPRISLRDDTRALRDAEGRRAWPRRRWPTTRSR